MANGNIKLPIGMLEKILLTSCGVQFEHTIVVVDFEEDPSYDIILGWPFMQQLRVIQNWGTNHIYLQQKKDVTCINWGDHSFQKVIKRPIDDWVLASSGEESSVPSWVSSKVKRQSDTVGDKTGNPMAKVWDDSHIYHSNNPQFRYKLLTKRA